MALRDSKKKLAMSVLMSTFGTPEVAQKGHPSKDHAAFSAATLLAARIGVKFSTALNLVNDWFGGVAA